MKHGKDPIREIFETLETYFINSSQAAHILHLSDKTADNWFFKYTAPSKTNYQRLRFLCYLVQEPIRVAMATLTLYSQKDKIKGMMDKIIPFSSTNVLVNSSNVLQTMNHLIHHSIQLDYNLQLEIRSFIHKHRRHLLDAIYLMYKVDNQGGIQNYSLQLVRLLDREIKIPSNYECKTYEDGRPPLLKKAI